MARENIDVEPIPDTLEGVRQYLARLRADLDSHNHDGANSKRFQTMKSETLTSRTIAMRKTSYASSVAGFWVGLVGATVKFDLGDSTNYLRWDGTSLSITGALTGGSITGATITGGLIQTATSGKRIVLDSSDNLMHVYDATAEVITLGTASARAITITLNSNNTDGIRINSSTDATLGIDIESSSNVTLNGLRIALSNTGSGNDGFAAYLENKGNATSAYCLDMLRGGNGSALRITMTGTGNSLEIQSSNSSGANVVSINQNDTSHNAAALYVTHLGTGIGVVIDQSTGGADFALKILHAAAGTAALFIDKNSSYAAIEIDQDVNNSAACFGLNMNINNAGSGKEYAFDFNGAEWTNAAVGGSQDRKINVRINTTDYYIPCYTA